MPITTHELLASLDAVSLGGLQDLGIERVRHRIREGNSPIGSHDDRAKDFVIAMLNQLTNVAAVPDFSDITHGLDLNVIRADIINACVIPSPDGPKIVIFTGFLKVLMFMLEFSNIVERIRGNQSKVIKATNLRERELEQTGYQAFTHIAHFAIWGTPLPRPYPQLTKAQRASNWMELTKNIWFIVAHELAHIRLGHISRVPNNNSGPAAYPSLALDEGANTLKLHEFEADKYIIETLSPQVGATILSWPLLILATFSSLERLLSNHKNSHPMAINRLNALKEVAMTLSDKTSVTVVSEIVDRQIEAERAHMSSKRNMYMHSSYETAQDALTKLQSYARYAAFFEGPELEAGNIERAKAWDLLWDHLGPDDE